jgi:aspartate/methionine/tyrosine aminotransferase
MYNALFAQPGNAVVEILPEEPSEWQVKKEKLKKEIKKRDKKICLREPSEW